MKKESREFQIFAKPVGATCNLRCKYCYYLIKKNLYPENKSLLMDDQVLERYILQHIEASTDGAIGFSWHGGEPFMAGTDFFRKVVQLQNKYKPSGRTIINGIQTNGTLIDDEWCRFLASEHFLVGISIDGPGDLHNKFRQTGGKRPTLQHVLKGYELLQKFRISSEILCVVNSVNVKYPLVVYDFFKQLEAKYITFLPLVEPLSGTPSGVSRNSVPSLEFGIFLSNIFDEWVEKDIGEVKIQIVEEAIRPAFNQEHTLCIFKETCGGVPVVEHNGDFYSCDHYVDSDHLVGNIMGGSLISYLDCERQEAFGREKSLLLPHYCKVCDVKQMCNGECPKNRFIRTPDGEGGLNYLCSGYKYFFTHCSSFIEAVGSIWRDQS
jgi:uncharacterized protein